MKIFNNKTIVNSHFSTSNILTNINHKKHTVKVEKKCDSNENPLLKELPKKVSVKDTEEILDMEMLNKIAEDLKNNPITSEQLSDILLSKIFSSK